MIYIVSSSNVGGYGALFGGINPRVDGATLLHGLGPLFA